MSPERDEFMEDKMNQTNPKAAFIAVVVATFFATLTMGCIVDDPFQTDGPDAGQPVPGECKGHVNALCRAAAGACDVPEYCNGVDDDCPNDALEAAGTQCRASDGDEHECTGYSPVCPSAPPDDCETNADCVSGRCVGGECITTFVVLEVSNTSGEAAEAHVFGSIDVHTDNTGIHSGSSPYTIGLTQTEACGWGVEVAMREVVTPSRQWYGCGAPGRGLSQIVVKRGGTVITGIPTLHPWACAGGGEGNLAFSKAQLGCP